MSRVTPEMRDFSNRLVAHELGENRSSKLKIQATFPVVEKLRPQLATLMGGAGFNALVARALALAQVDVALLRGVHVETDGSLKGLDELGARSDADQVFESQVVLLTQILGLLVAFIGEKLTLRLVLDAWPTLPVTDLRFGKGYKQ